ncbi:hypothetical protein RvY_07932 [Ramazzottius varieornatus]|uniref:Uncharacterized protein n=1 Tax=Ramazzottius varieornatus TaxID=947166 RepID=A0A1D1V9W4_RAMVA|nr:hypothetical protein RvY_07932 [Ramazzottius varieornatus]
MYESTAARKRRVDATDSEDMRTGPNESLTSESGTGPSASCKNDPRVLNQVRTGQILGLLAAAKEQKTEKTENSNDENWEMREQRGFPGITPQSCDSSHQSPHR